MAAVVYYTNIVMCFAHLMERQVMLLLMILLGWGFWGFFGKIAADKLGHQILFWNGISSYVIFIIYLAYTKQLNPLKGDINAISFALLSGIAIAVGSCAYYILLKQGPAGKLVTMAAMYPIITIFPDFRISVSLK